MQIFATNWRLAIPNLISEKPILDGSALGEGPQGELMQKEKKSPVNRRSFLKGAAAGAAAFVAKPVLAEPQAPPQTPAARAEASGDGRPASDFMVDIFKSLGIEYALAMPAGNFAGVIESVAHYG